MIVMVHLTISITPVPEISKQPPPAVIIDFDPAGLVWSGLDVDDDLALLSAVAFERMKRLSIVGITVVAGNAPLKHTEENARKLMALAGLSKPFGVGASWHDQQIPWPLQVLNFVSPDRQSSNEAALFIINQTMARPPQTLTVITLGPVSNLAHALSLEPKLAKRLRRVILMGGELTGGSKLDLNFILDRGAARAVFKAPVEKLLVPIQLCAQVLCGSVCTLPNSIPCVCSRLDAFLVA
jgi:purine nucleosidase